jgi:hypothetical protein
MAGKNKKRGREKEINTRNNLDATFLQTLGRQKKAINKTYDNVESVPLIQNDPIHFMNMD